MRTPSRELSLVCILVAAACFVDRGPTGVGSTSGVGTSGSSSTGATTGAPTTSTTGEGTTGEDMTGTGTSAGASTGGESSSDSTTGPGFEGTCQELCKVDADCEVGGKEQGLTCQGGRCIDGLLCEGNGDCQAFYTGWVMPCATQAECTGQVCIDIGGGVGRCAVAPTDEMACAALMLVEVVKPSIEGGAIIPVCANLDYTCDAGVCGKACKDNTGCAQTPGHPQCVVDTGVCACTSDEQCELSGQGGYALCRDGRCGCGVDDDCKRLVNADTCLTDGRCGCTSTAVCTQTMFDGTVLACVGA